MEGEEAKGSAGEDMGDEEREVKRFADESMEEYKEVFDALDD